MLIVEGVTKLRDDLAKMAGRMADPIALLEGTFAVLEEAEAKVFADLAGRYVDTGLTMDSLTQRSANHAIREAHGVEALFGTSVWYAHFLTKEIVHDKRLGGSAILVNVDEIAPEVSQQMMREWMWDVGV